MLGTLSSFGSLLGGAGSFLGGLGIGGGGGINRKAIFDQHKMALNAQKKALRDLPSFAIQGAKKSGLHPLTVLGQTPTQGGSATMLGGSNVDFAQMGQGIDRAANSFRGSTERRLDELALEKAQLSNDYLKTQIAGAQKAIAQSGATPPMSNSTRTGSNNSSIPTASKLYRNYDGSTSLLTSEQASEAYEAMGIAGQADFITRNWIPHEISKKKASFKKAFSKFKKNPIKSYKNWNPLTKTYKKYKNR